MNALYTRYNLDGSIWEQEVIPTDVIPGDRVMFVDNSYLNYCQTNKAGDRTNLSPAGWDGKNDPGYLQGTVVRVNSVQEVVDRTSILGPRTIQMPVVVLGDDGSVIYCNGVHIRRLD